jgi:hypothetical protein
MHPQFPGEVPINPFDLWDGANFKLKIRQVDGYRNYDKSEFDKQAPLFDDDNELATKITEIHSLQELIDPKHFKSYEELKTRLEKAIGLASDTGRGQLSHAHEEEEAFPTPSKSTPAKEAPKASPPWDEDDDEDLSFFKKLASD